MYIYWILPNANTCLTKTLEDGEHDHMADTVSHPGQSPCLEATTVLIFSTVD